MENNKDLKGIALNTYMGIWSLLIFILVVVPLYNIFIGFGDAPGIFTQIYNGISYDGNSQLADFSAAKSIIGGIIGSIVIFFIVYIHNDFFKSGLKTGLIHVVTALNTMTISKDMKKNDPEQYSALKVKIGVYSGVLLAMFVIYFILINNITTQIIQGDVSIIFLIGIIIQALVIIGANTVIVKALDNRNPTPEIEKNKIVYTDEQIASLTEHPNSMGIEVAIAILLISIIAIGVSQQFSDYTTQQIQSSEYGNVIEGDGSSLDNILNN